MKIQTLLLCLSMATLMAIPLSAQGYVYCPDNNPATGGSNSFPMAGFAGLKIQELIPASNLPAAKFKIIDIALAPVTAATHTHQQFQVRMAQTNKTALSATVDDNLGLCPINCYLGTHTWGPTTAAQWNDLGLQASFGYDPNDPEGPNLVIEYRKRGGSWVPNQFIGQRTGGFNRNYNSTVPTDPWTATTRQGNDSSGPKVRLMIDRVSVLTCDRKVNPGGSAKIVLDNAPTPASYQMATSLGDGSVTGGIPVGPCRVWLDLDPVMLASVLGLLPTVFQNYAGAVSPAGTATGTVNVPNVPALVGVKLYHAAITISTFITCTNTSGTLITT